MNVPSLIDLSGVVAIVASSGAVSALLQWLRDIGLDRLTQAMPDTQRNALLRALLLSAGLTAFIGAAGSHVLYQYVQPRTPALASVAPSTPLSPPAPHLEPLSPAAWAATLDASAQPDPFAPIVLPDTDTTPAPAADAPATPASA